MANKHLLTLNDLYDFYSTKKKSMNFDCNKSGYNVVVQTEGQLSLFDEDLSEGLLYAKARAFHDLTNNNKSHIKTDVFEEKIKSLKDRPVMADIVETGDFDENGNPIKDFSGHSMYYSEDKEKFVYMEIPVGHFVNPDDIKVEYDEEYDRNFAVSDIVIYEEYTDACEILRRRGSVDCSVELVIKSMSWNNADKVLMLNDFYVQGCTLLGENVKPGMSGSKVQLKDFSEQNNSIFSSIDEKTNEKLIETLDRINNTLSSLNINNKDNGEEVEPIVKKEFEINENEEAVVVEEENVVEENTAEDTLDDEAVFEDSDATDDDSDGDSTEDGEEADTSDEPETNPDDGDNEEDGDNDDGEDEGSTDDDEDGKKKTYSMSFKLSHDDIRVSLYRLLEPYSRNDNDWYWICKVYDNNFIYQGIMGEYHGHEYSVDGDNVQLVGEPYALYAEFLTQGELDSLNEMRSNYSALKEELSNYKKHEDYIEKLTLFDNEEYTKYMDTDEFKTLMSEDSLIALTKDEIIEKADAIIGKFMRMKKFTLDEEPKAKTPMFAFSRNNTTECSFLDGLLNNK